ncbi:MAG: transketolase family protein [Euryarchaeota archaeon]|nr:transketolase family protein [Euryarchaeota archaeon]
MTKKTTRDFASQTILEEGRKNPNLVVLDADLALSTKTIRFKQTFPDRFFDMGIQEQNMMGVAAGLATCGKTVIAATFATFATAQCYNVIRQSICYPRLNVKIYATHGGISVGGDGATHQMVEDIALMKSLPGMTVLAPSDAQEVASAVHAMCAFEGPTYLRLGRNDEPDIFESVDPFEIGKAHMLLPGDDITIAAMGTMTKAALIAAKQLEKEGIGARVLHCPTIKPLDEDAVVRAARETGAIVSCEEHTVLSGLGASIAWTLARHHPTVMGYVGIKDTFGESGSGQELIEKYGLGVKDIVCRVKEVLEVKKKQDRATVPA